MNEKEKQGAPDEALIRAALDGAATAFAPDARSAGARALRTGLLDLFCAGDPEAALAARVLREEHRLYPAAIARVLDGLDP